MVSVLIKIKQDEMIVTASSIEVTFKITLECTEWADTKHLGKEGFK